LLLAAVTPKVSAQSTTFTYQGRLTENGLPASGVYDLQLTVFNAVSGGGSVGTTSTFDDLTVSNGLFTVILSPGATVFDGSPRWLEIAIRPGASAGAYTNLAPRQEITSAPYAIRAANVANGAITAASLADGSVTASKLAPGAVSQLGASDGSPTNALQVDAAGLVGIGTGTNAPAAGLQIASSATVLNARALFQATDGNGGFDNLAGAGYLNTVVRSNLLVLIGNSDSAVNLIDISNPSAPVIISQIVDGVGGFTNIAGPVGVAFGSNNVMAIAASGDDAVTLVNISNPASPVKLAELKDGVAPWNDLADLVNVVISGNTMAILSYTDNALTLVDISNPSSPVLRVVIKQGQFGFDNLQAPSDVDVSGNLLAVSSTGSNAVTLIDISNPSSPIKRAEIIDGQNGFNSLSYPFSVAFGGNLLAVVGALDNAVTLVDVSNPSSPVQRGVISNTDALLGITVGSAISGNQLAIGGEKGVALYDISNPSTPRLIAMARDNEAGLNNLNTVYSLAFAGTNLVVPGNLDNALTIIGFTNSAVSLATAGWVGIGTTLPAAPLTVVGNVIVRDANDFSVSANRVQFGSSAASGNFATAFGHQNLASGNNSTAFGDNTVASGDSSTAFGISTVASGSASVAFGQHTIANGLNAFAMGDNSVADGQNAMAMGFLCTATGTVAVAMGETAHANHNGTFVWADGVLGGMGSTAPGQFLIRASGGVGINTNVLVAGAAFHVAGTSRFSGAAIISGSASIDGRTSIGGLASVGVTTNVPTAGSALVPVTSCIALAPTSPVTLSPVNAILEANVDGIIPTGTLLILRGTSDVNTVTINDGANTALGANRVLGLNDSLTLFFNGDQWVEIAFANN
jgi:hypothetical protein